MRDREPGGGGGTGTGRRKDGKCMKETGEVSLLEVQMASCLCGLCG